MISGCPGEPRWWFMDQKCNENICEALRLAQELLRLADQGDTFREDVGCGVLYGTIRDCAYKIRALAETEIEAHKKKKQWTIPEVLAFHDQGIQ
jgi:hypothetical protein